MTKAHLLLIEDSVEVAQVVRILCRRAGHTLSWHTDGTSVPSSPRPDLLLLDLNLPDEDGIELYRRLSQPAGPLAGVPAALFTQGAAAPRIAAALDGGIDFIVSKELLGRPEEWNRRLNEVLELAASATESEAQARDSLARASDSDHDAHRGDPAALARALRHPILLRLGDEVIAAMLRRVVALHLPAHSAVDVAVSSATLAADLTLLVSSCPDAVARLVHGLGRQAECLLGHDASAPLRDALTAALA